MESGAGPKYRMVALDLDGTLLQPDHTVSNETVDYLRALHDKGLTIAIATGRSAAATADVVHRLNLCRKIESSDNEGMPVVCVNGAKGICVAVTNTSTGTGTNIGYENKKGNPMLDGRLTITKELFHEPVPYDVTEKTLDLAIKNGYTVNYYVDHIIYAQSSETLHEKCIQAYMDLTGVNITKISEGDSYSEAKKLGLPSKLLVLTGEEKLDEAVTFFKKELANDATVIRGSPPFFVEILNKTVCKGFGLQRMCQVFDIPLEKTIAFGDGDNDAEFIQMAGLGIAMKNARQNIKDLADDITEFTNAENGVIRALQQLEKDNCLFFPKEV